MRSLPIGLTVTAMKLSAKARLTPFGAYHWIMYSKSMWFDLTEAKEELGWAAQYSTDDMFRESYDWFLAHRDDAVDLGASQHRSAAKQGALRVAHLLLR